MNKKYILISIIVIAIIAGGVFYFLYKQQPPPIIPSQTPDASTTTPPIIGSGNYNTEPLTECVECENGKTWDNKPCCTANFEKDCASKNGVVRWSDLHPVSTVLRGCFQKAPDTGKACAITTDCLSGVCDLESAIKSNKCTLIRKELTGEKNRFSGKEFYTASYSCGIPKPGACTETISNSVNPGGESRLFMMNNKTLIETLGSGQIN